ncbi:dTDP-4-dehydrorhamnose 3,5-epimerase family protein [Candidatus Gottesmanbacteria bacterium]|nr:dTDP-4-dehydrorhamnose 3,5-epimerase family protein [Candidatus Gottesmanbacteria bacterium]
MKFIPTKFDGVYFIDLQRHEDNRGFLARTFDTKEFYHHGIDFTIKQSYMTKTEKKGTLRGFHYQISPKEEAKLIRCTRGSIFEAIIDLRPKSKTYKKWAGFSVHANEYKMLYIPPLFAHAILSLEDDTEVLNLTSALYSQEYEHGIRYDDPLFNIDWPNPVTTVSQKDKSWENFQLKEHLRGGRLKRQRKP